MALHEIHWEVTNKCNLRCRHCLSASGKPRPAELSTSEAIATLVEFHSTGVAKIYFTGGEPFSRLDFLDLLKKTYTLGMQADVITNATILTKEILALVKKFGVGMGISLDGADSAANDAIRGRGTFVKVLESLRLCQNSGIPVQLYVTVTKRNVLQLRELAQLAKTYGCIGIHFNELTLAGRAREFELQLALSAEEQIGLSNTIKEVVADIFGEKLSQQDDACWVDGKMLYMTAEGNLYLCSEIFQRRPDLTIGNIRTLSFQQWLEDNAEIFDHQKKCCYGIQVSRSGTLITNVSSVCAFTPQRGE